MKKYVIVSCSLILGLNFAFAQTEEAHEIALRNIERSKSIIDAAWESSMKGDDNNLYMADSYNTVSGTVSGPSDVWPYTAAIEAHNSLLEALVAAKDIAPEVFDQNYDKYLEQLVKLIDNLEYYRGTYRLTSYATSNKEWSPYAVPRASERGKANVSGILNVYDDQMWLARELIRAYKITGNEDYLDEAIYLTDYVLEGWDCWRDENGEEYGGITWGPGYNSKHSCSNGSIIQPLVWLYDIYKDNGEEMEYAYRDANNNVVTDIVDRSEYYMEFATKIYDWQKAHLLHSSGVYWDMMGADNTILTSRGYRQHVDCGAPTGSLISYNTGTMIAGAAELYRVTDDQTYSDDLNHATNSSLVSFGSYLRKINGYDFKTDDTAENGFTTWFNDVLLRACIDAVPYSENTSAQTIADSFQTCLDYAFENHNRNNLLPIHLIDGWGNEEVTKAFHQFAFASEYAVLASNLLKENEEAEIKASFLEDSYDKDILYSIQGIKIGEFQKVKQNLSPGIYVINHKKIVLN